MFRLIFLLILIPLAARAADELTAAGREAAQRADSTALSNKLALPIGFAESARIALEQNFDLKSLRDQSESLKFKSGQALAPNPLIFSYNRNDIAGFSPGGTPFQEQYQLGLTLGFPGKAQAASSALRHQSESAREDSYGKEIDLMISLASNFVAQKANRELDGILGAEVEKAKTLIQLQQTKYATAQAAQADIMGSRVNLSRLQQQLLSNNNDFLALKNEFTNLLGRPDKAYVARLDEGFNAPESLFAESELNQLMFSNRPSLRSLERQSQATASALKGAYLQALPDFALTAAMNQYTIPETVPVPGLTRDYSFGISITLPLFFPVNELQGIRAAKSDLSSSDNKLRSSQVAAASELATAYVNYTALVEEEKQMETTVIPAARSYYSLGLAAYSAGRSDFLRLNDARSMFLNAQFDLIAKKKQVQQTFFQLVQIVGCDFTKKAGAHACE